MIDSSNTAPMTNRMKVPCDVLNWVTVLLSDTAKVIVPRALSQGYATLVDVRKDCQTAGRSTNFGWCRIPVSNRPIVMSVGIESAGLNPMNPTGFGGETGCTTW